MARRKAVRRDSMNGPIEGALLPGSFISYYEGSAFVSGLRRVEEAIAGLIASEPARAVALFETFVAGCYAKAEEIDDSDGEFGTFAGDLFLGWIRARQTAGADRDETTSLLLKFMEEDDYGFTNDLELSAVNVLDRKGIESFERTARGRFDAGTGYERDRWCRALKAIYSQRGEARKYIGLTEATGLTETDCVAIATIFKAKRKPKEALAWVERGLGIEKRSSFDGADYQLGEMRRSLLAKLGRGDEALDLAWAEYSSDPDESSYGELIRYVPGAERRVWHEKAMEAAERGDLDSVIGLWLEVKEFGRLASRVERTSDTELENLSHYVTEPAAVRLAKTHPGSAAKLFRAICMRVVDAGKSKYYSEALSSLEEAKNCYQLAGLDADWQALVAEIRREHHRKSGFMPGFERIVRGGVPPRKPSFQDWVHGRR